jgi:hypothetical protein
MQAHPRQDQETQIITHSFPSGNVLDIAVAKLMALQERHLNLAPNTNVERLLARHAPTRPQVPNFKPAA